MFQKFRATANSSISGVDLNRDQQEGAIITSDNAQRLQRGVLNPESQGSAMAVVKQAIGVASAPLPMLNAANAVSSVITK